MKLSLINIVFIIIVSISFTACSEEKVNPGIEKNVTNSEITQEGWNSYLLLTENGKLKTILHYEHMAEYGEKRITLLQKIKVDFYDSTQTATSWLTADSGRVEENNTVMYAIGNVIAMNDSGRVLRTEQLVWRSKTQKITTDRFVTITSPKEDLQGYGFESDPDIRNWVIFKPVLNTIINQDNNKK